MAEIISTLYVEAIWRSVIFLEHIIDLRGRHVYSFERFR